jgi:hypothetical protein
VGAQIHVVVTTAVANAPRPRSGMLEAELQEGDRVTFISTLHGG